MYIKIITILKTFFRGLCGFVVIILTLSVFGKSICEKIIYDYSKPENRNLFFVFKDSDDNEEICGFEDDFLKYTNKTEKVQIQQLDNTQEIQTGQAVAVNLSALSGKYGVNDGKAVINNTNYDVTSLLHQSYSLPQITKEQPSVLIYHTHTSEGYEGGGTVVDIGNVMTEEFEKRGYKTIHITDIFDKEQFSGAYSRSIVAVEKILKENPSVKLVFDVHRDSITDSNGVKYRPITTINGEQSAQVMFVCGTDEKGLSHPNWRENFKFALDVSKKLGEDCNGLSRPVNLRADRFNTHVTNHTFLIEMGSEKNTLEEVKRSAVYTVQSIIATIEKTK